MDHPVWEERLRGDPVAWLLEDEAPAVRHLALRRLLHRSADDPEVAEARAAAMSDEQKHAEEEALLFNP